MKGLIVRLKAKVKEERNHLTIAVMGCRVNGPGETDDADLGLWCGPKHVNLKRGPETVGTFGYDEIVEKLRDQVAEVLATRGEA